MEQTQKLLALRQRVEGWRRDGGGRGSRIPEEMWNEAVVVSRTAGLYATARALRFNYENLKKRAAKRTPRPRTPVRRPEFVSLPMAPMPEGAKVVVALVARDGEQMRMEVTGASAMDMVALAQAFWRRRP